MKRYLLDTNAMADLINHRHAVADRAIERRNAGSKVGTCMPVVAELFFGIEASKTRDENRRRLVRSLKRIVCWPFDRAAAEEYGRIAAELKSIGRRIQQVDMMIAAIAKSLGTAPS